MCGINFQKWRLKGFKLIHQCLTVYLPLLRWCLMLHVFVCSRFPVNWAEDLGSPLSGCSALEGIQWCRQYRYLHSTHVWMVSLTLYLLERDRPCMKCMQMGEFSIQWGRLIDFNWWSIFFSNYSMNLNIWYRFYRILPLEDWIKLLMLWYCLSLQAWFQSGRCEDSRQRKN